MMGIFIIIKCFLLKIKQVNDDNKDKDYNIVVIQEFTPVVYDDQGNLIANWQQVYETE